MYFINLHAIFMILKVITLGVKVNVLLRYANYEAKGKGTK